MKTIEEWQKLVNLAIDVFGNSMESKVVIGPVQIYKVGKIIRIDVNTED